MTGIASELKDNGFVLRSGHADGADLAFELGSQGQNQIFLPWRDFNYDSPLSKGLSKAAHYFAVGGVCPTAERIAATFHPNWKACTEAAKKMHRRNVRQILGPGMGHINTETVSKFVVCWTKDGKASGGTGQAIRIAEGCEIPVFNLFHQDALSKLADFISEMP